MNKVNILTAIAAIIISAASCGGQQPKTTASEVADAADTLAVVPQPSEEQQPSGMTDAAFSELLLNVIYQLPASVMPDYLKAEDQRRDVVTEYAGNDNYVNPTVFSHWYEDEYYYTRYEWMMAGYLTEDNRNIVLIVQYGSYLDGYLLMSDKTLNYDIESQTFTEMERPMEMPTVDEMIVETNFDSQRLYNRAKAHFNKKMELNYNGFDKEGFRVNPNHFKFWDENSDYDYYSAPFMMAIYKWDGTRFYKDKIVNSKEFYDDQD